MASNDNTNSSSAAHKIFNDIDGQLRDMKLSLTSTFKQPANKSFNSYLEKVKATKQKLATIKEQVETTEQIIHEEARITSSVYSRSESGNLSNKQLSIDDEAAKLEAWLERGSRRTSSGDSDSTLSLSAFPMIETSNAPIKLPMFSKVTADTERFYYGTSPTPLTPLNNDRDTYGNYIATNPYDYLATCSPPSSLIKPENSPRATVYHDTPMTRLRGGGSSWWENLGMYGKTAHTTAAKSNGHTTLSHHADTSSGPLSNPQDSRIRQSTPISAGTRPLTNMLSSYGRTDIPVRGGPRSPLFKSNPLPCSIQNESSGTIVSDLATPPALLGDQFRPSSASSGRSFTTISSYSRALRPEKKWDMGISHQPPSTLPPPPIPEKSSRRSQASSFAGQSDTQCYYPTRRREQEMYPDDSFSQCRPPTSVFDAASPQFGESANDGPWQRLSQPPRPHPKSQPACPARPQGMYIRPNDQPTEEEFEAYTQEVEANFRVQAHEIMTRYNMNKARVWRALQRNQVSQELYDRDVDGINKWLMEALRRAEVDTGYAVSSTRTSIRGVYPGRELESWKIKRCANLLTSG